MTSMMQKHDLRLAVYHDPGHPSKPWAVGVETGPGKLQVSDRYEIEVGANRVVKRLLPMFRKHVRRPTRGGSPSRFNADALQGGGFLARAVLPGLFSSLGLPVGE